MPSIDINCDMGEIPKAILDGMQESLMPSLTSVNIACGGHAGDHSTMKMTIEQASRWNLNIGAHPGYPDRANFGRVDMHLPLNDIEATIFEQVRDLSLITASLGATVVHVKPHGALYNRAAGDAAMARAIARGAGRLSKNLILVGLAGSLMLDVFRDEGFAAVGEAFADRLYEPDGTLRSRKFDHALIREPDRAAEQAVRIAQRGEVNASNGAVVRVQAQTICIHGDTPGAPRVAAAVAKKLREAGVELRPLSRS
jgi:5-oxoprolinase (ATP-hydrolysing) subunit A